MSQNKIKVSTEEILYYVLFSLLLFTKGVGLDEGMLSFRICFLLAIVFLGCKFLVGKYSIRELLMAGILGIWGVATFRITGSLGMMIYVLLILGMKNVTVRRVFKVGAVLWGACMAFSFTAAVFAGRTGVRIVHEKMGLGPLLRESLGYTHPNVLHITYVVFMAFVLYLVGTSRRTGKKKLIGIIALLLIGDAYVFLHSVSYTGLLISFVYLVCFFYFTFRKEISKPESALIQGILPVCVMISTVLPPLLSTEGMAYKVLNSLLNSRVWAIRTYYMYYSVTLLGMSSEGITFSIDNSYVSALMGYGIIFLIVMVLVYWQMIRFFIREGKRQELAILCAFFVAGLSEPFLFNASIKNITVVFVGYFMYLKTGGESNIAFFQAGNKMLEINTRWLTGFQGRLTLVNKKVLAGVFGIIWCIVLVGLLPKNMIRTEIVYADEGLCDCGGETVRLPSEEPKGNVLYIGEKSRDINYYCFTRENSSLIEVMDLRLKVSTGLYAAILGSMIVLCVCLKGNFHEKSIPDSHHI